jgi:hypothetical protein
MFTLPTQPMTLSDAIKNSFSLWWTTLTSVLPLSIVAALLNGLPILAKSYLGETHVELYIATFVVVVIINIIPTTAIFAKLGHAAHNQPITLSQSVAASIVKFPAVLLWIIISTVVVLSGCGLAYLTASHPIALILGILILVFIFASLAVYVLCVMPLIIFENLPVIDAIQKSFALTKNHWWYGGVLLTVIVAFAAVVNAAGTLLMGSLGSIIAYCFTLPLQTSMIIIFYEQLKLRAEKI